MDSNSENSSAASVANPWFHGSVASAVEAARANGSLLLVCLVDGQGEGSESERFESRFKNATVHAELSTMALIPLRLVKDSVDGAMFAQIFPVMVVPALYLIRNNMLADFMNSSIQTEEMLERIRAAIAGHFRIPPPPGYVPATPSPSALQASSTPPVSTAPAPAPVSHPVSTPVAATEQDVTTETTTVAQPASPESGFARPTVQENELRAQPATIPPSAPSIPAVSTSSVNSGSPSTPTHQAQVLKDLMKERQQKREKEEKEAAKQREIDRRNSSKALQDAQRDLTDKQSKKARDQVDKEKREEAEYKKKVMRDLEEDKARRKAERERAKALAAQQSQETTAQETQAHNPTPAQLRNDAAPALAFDTSRLNIRLFDGSSIRNTFKATDTLQRVREWIDTNQDGDNAYNIAQIIPARTFLDESKMLRDLELCPSATLVLKRTAVSYSAYEDSEGAVSTAMGYGWSALGFAGKLANSAYSTLSYYNPLADSRPSSSSSNTTAGPSGSRNHTSDSARQKKKDTESTYNGNSTNLE
ncbi:hypothetical protein BGW38_003225 [Lunasporangiospora selenospora]|uniref:UBX domain-containing protein n=1 Tax=Lunasporangiospora selenospora TaxID=979761 RepID=A0A9P6FRB5_9FUNG|nr:hypothetical protein BGW38_003225 [Lunasporangiospora selenospora]